MALPLPPAQRARMALPAAHSDDEAQAIVTVRQQADDDAELGARFVAKFTQAIIACPRCNTPAPHVWPVDGIPVVPDLHSAKPACGCGVGLVRRVHEATEAERQHDFIHRMGDVATCRACCAKVEMHWLCVVAGCDQCGAKMPADQCSATALRIGAVCDNSLYALVAGRGVKRKEPEDSAPL
jgi:hypothetical protein